MSDEQPTAPFAFRPAARQPTRVNDASPDQPRKRGRKPRAPAPEGEAPKRKRRARTASDVLVLKACLRQLRTLDAADALRMIETLRILFK